MRHRILLGSALAVWVVCVAGSLASGPPASLAWLIPMAVVSTAGLLVRLLRTLAWLLPVAAVAGLDTDAPWSRVGAALLAVVAAIVAVGLLDAWSDSRPDRTVAAVCDPADLRRWRRARRPALLVGGAWLVAAAMVWLALDAVTWSAPGWLLAAMPAIAISAVAAATWPLWRPNGWR